MAKKVVKEASKAEAFYIEQHWGTKTADQIAADLEIPVERVDGYIQKLRDAGLNPPPPKEKPTNVEKAGFAVHDPVDEDGNKGKSFSTAMTGAAAHLGDESTKKAAESGGEKFMRTRLKNSIHVIDPSKPIR